MSKEKEKTKKVILKVKPSHPAQKFRLGSHTITVEPKAYELNEAEQKELESAGCKAWLIVVEKKAEAPQAPAAPAAPVNPPADDKK